MVETLGRVGSRKAEGLSVGKLPGAIAGVLRPHVEKQELTVEAALEGDRGLALEALRMDPLVRDKGSSGKMLDELLEANMEFLPRFQ